MIDQQRLEHNFAVIGKNKIPAFVDLFLKSYKRFGFYLQKYIKLKDRNKAYCLVHKVKGSAANFCCQQFIGKLQIIEDKLMDEMQNITKEDVDSITALFNLFCEELKTIKKNFQ